jgi:uncharacterized protein
MKSVFLTFVLLLSVAFSSCGRLSQGEVKKEETLVAPVVPVVSRFPPPIGLVNDYAQVLDGESRTRLDALLTKLKTKANVEFAIVTVETTKGEPIFDYSLALAREWGVGAKDTSLGGGLLLILAVKDRQWRLQVSRSLEKDLPEEVCKELGDQSLALYKEGKYGEGIEKYVTALITRLEQHRNFSLD